MFEKEIYIERRKKLRHLVNSGVILLPGNNESPMNAAANTYQFRQDSSFLYFFGLNKPQLAGIMDIDEDREIIFGDDVDIDDVIWMGNQESVLEKARKSGVNEAKPFNELYGYIKTTINSGRQVHFLPPYRAYNILLISQLINIPPDRVQKEISVTLIQAIVTLRSVKEDCEIKELEKAWASGYDMHVAAMKLCSPGIHEYEITGHIEGIAKSNNGNISFPVILTQNGETLHNHYHGNRLSPGKLMLTDAGSETSMCYASDFTRTVPVSGRFTKEQRDIYQIVLQANNTAFELIKPGVPFRDIHLAAAKVITSGLMEMGVMKGYVEDAVAQGAHALFFPHGLGHMIGLDVHDMEDLGEDYVGYDEEIQRSDQFGLANLRLGRRLQENFYITNEPGIYFIPALIEKWEGEKINTDFIHYDKVKNFIGFGGIRLEDDVLVTKDGAKYPGQRIPIDPDDIERIMKD